MMPERLLAKSVVINRPPVTLISHSLDVASCAEMLFGTVEGSTSLGRAWCRFFKLDSFEPFLFNLKLACLFHDLGKATPGFQQALERQGVQIFRHEYLSAFLLLEDSVRCWLTAHPQVYFPGVLAAVAGHHLKASPRNTQVSPNNNRYVFGEPSLDWSGRPEIRMYFDHQDVQHIWKQIAAVLGSEVPADLPSALVWTCQDIARLEQAFGREAHRYKKSLYRQNGDAENTERFMRALKAAVIVCDALGSAMPRMMDGKAEAPHLWAEQFTRDCFGGPALDNAWIEENIIQPRIRAIEAGGHSFTPHDFQRGAARQPARTLLLSGCGSGKTLAAWYWIQAQLQHFEARRVIFLYPTRATATEGFRDYVSLAGGEAAGLLHGTALYDLQGMFTNPDDPRTDVNYSSSEAFQRLYALQHWPKQVLSATVDSFLGFMANSYSAICLLPLLADSVLVVDEAHAFDSAMFKALQEFLRHFDIPVLCMTASLPENRRERLENDLGMKRFPENPADFADLKQQMTYPRYQLERIEADSAQEQVISAFQDGRRILWVVNQVDRCQRLARALRDLLPEESVLCYHSRFRLCDRKRIHEAVIDRFKQKPSGEGLILVTTQVCEMSLDLDADMLVTDLAPIPSLIQRMGRCCRGRLRMVEGNSGLVLVTEPEKERPYSPEELTISRQFLEHLLSLGQNVSQWDMNAYLESMDTGMKGLPKAWTAFIEEGLYSPHSSDAPFRDADDFTVDAVLSCDIPEYLALRKVRDPKCDGLVVPVPKYPQAKRNERLPQGLMEASNAHYSENFGFCKEEVPDYV